VSLHTLKIKDFRCIESAELAVDPNFNLIFGANASGKTSILEAIAYLGRGKSFRGASTRNLIRHGSDEFLLNGKVGDGAREASIGVRNSRAGLEVSIDGDRSAGAAELAELLPLQVVEPDVHGLISGGPELRRRYLDWIAFHVEPGYLDAWRRFRRVLKQRNAALRDCGSELGSWDREFCDASLVVDDVRRRMLAGTLLTLQGTGVELLEAEVDFEYQQGWGSDLSLPDALRAAEERDLAMGATQAGPHRGDLKLIYDQRQARKLVSRGQQKLLACTLILAATEVVQTELEKPLLLLLDDPAAELDPDSLGRLMLAVIGLGCQVIATSLGPDTGLFPDPPAVFHVEHGKLQKVV